MRDVHHKNWEQVRHAVPKAVLVIAPWKNLGRCDAHGHIERVSAKTLWTIIIWPGNVGGGFAKKHH